MINLRTFAHPALALSAAALLSLSACNKPADQAAVESQSQSSSLTSAATDSSMDPGNASAYPALLQVIENTQDAVYAKDFAKAQQAFDQFEPAWQQVEDGIKKASSKTYDDVEQDMEAVSKAIRAQDAEAATDALKAMNAHILSAA